MSKYTAITLGPIYNTFKKARSTREIWGASYIFSYLDRGIIIKLINSSLQIDADVLKDEQFKKLIEEKKEKFIIPNLENSEVFNINNSVGLFPDNIIFNSQLLSSEEKIQDIIDKVMNEFANEVASQIGKNKDKVLDFLKSYFRILPIELDAEHPIIDITPSLNSLELNPYYVSEIDENYLDLFLKNINKKKGFLEKKGIPRFESLLEISTNSLTEYNDYQELLNKYNEANQNQEKEGQEDFLKGLKGCEKFRNYNKYIAFIKADGDKIGKTLQELINEEDVQVFSKKIMNWGIESKKITEHFGAKAIYIGGDDLLIFSPIVNSKEENFLELVQKITEKFNNTDWTKKGGAKPSLSFGISINYYKEPMLESIEEADDLLKKAKKIGGNSIAVSFTKHSGSEMPFQIFHTHVKVFNDFLLSLGTEKEKNLINSVLFKIRENLPLIEVIKNDDTRITNFFENILGLDVGIGFGEQTKNLFSHHLKSTSFEGLYKKELKITKYKKRYSEETELAVNQFFSAIKLAIFMSGLDEIK